jgi:hyperosmotically inducible periplasmic protein
MQNVESLRRRSKDVSRTRNLGGLSGVDRDRKTGATMKRTMWVAAATLALVAVGTMPALAQSGAPPSDKQLQLVSDTSRSDAALADRIAEKVRRYVNYTIFDDVSIGVDRGVVTLYGRVTMPYKAKDLLRIVSRVDGVLEVNNELGVLPVSIHDDRLRVSIARQIYRDPVFSRYAIHVNPPIHIVVERGQVTLTGAVNSLVERQKAEFIARSTFGVFNVENRLRIDS